MVTQGLSPGSRPDGTDLRAKARRIRLLLTDCDGVLTDGGVYYSERGEEMKRFSMRDGMGVERLRKLAGVEVGIISGEHSGSIAQRARKLAVVELHLGIADKAAVLAEILDRLGLTRAQVAYIGDDVNDLCVMQGAGLVGCPADAMESVKSVSDYVCARQGGRGAFREFAELIIDAHIKRECPVEPVHSADKRYNAPASLSHTGLADPWCIIHSLNACD